MAAVVAAAALRVAWLLYTTPEPVSDFKQYRLLALGLLDTGVFGVGGPSAWRLPGFPTVLAAGAAIDRDPVALGAVTVLLSVVQVALTWWVARRAFGSATAATAAALTAAVLPAFVAFAPVLASEHLLAALVLAALGVALGAAGRGGGGRQGAPGVRPGRILGRGFAVGVLLGLATLTRGEALAYLPAVAGVVVIGTWRRTGRRGVAVGAAAITVVGLLLVVAPWVVRNERVVGAGAGLTTTGGFNFALAHSPDGYGWRTPLPLPLLVDDEVVRDELGWRWGLRHLRQQPGDLVATTRRGTVELLGPAQYAARYATVRFDPDLRRVVARDDLRWRDPAITAAGVASPALLLAALAGLAVPGVWRRSARLAVVGIVGANWALYAVVFWAQPRYRFVVDAVACVAVGALAVGIVRRRTPRGRGARTVRRPWGRETGGDEGRHRRARGWQRGRSRA